MVVDSMPAKEPFCPDFSGNFFNASAVTWSAKTDCQGKVLVVSASVDTHRFLFVLLQKPKMK